MNQFVKDRHKAFADILFHDDYREMDKYCKKYKVPMPKDRKIQKAAVLKAIQECTDFSEEDKRLAKTRCIDMGFKPFIDFKEETK